MKSTQLTAIILTRNEQENIQRCLNSLKFSDEILVIDDYSDDLTVQIAEENGAKVYIHGLNSDYSSQRNFALSKAAGSWVLFVDADEIVTKELAGEIRSVIENDTVIMGYYLKRYDYLWDKKLDKGEIGSVRLLRLARRGTGEWSRKVHEVWEIRGETGYLDNPLLHYPHQTLNEFIRHVDEQSTIHALANNEEGKKSGVIKIIFWPIAKFIQNWIIRGGFLNGTVGIIIALMMSFHSYLAWSKLWLLQKKASG